MLEQITQRLEPRPSAPPAERLAAAPGRRADEPAALRETGRAPAAARLAEPLGAAGAGAAGAAAAAAARGAGAGGAPPARTGASAMEDAAERIGRAGSPPAAAGSGAGAGPRLFHHRPTRRPARSCARRER